jgi:GTP cyclohydrolase I
MEGITEVEARRAIETLLAYLEPDTHDREGLTDTPARVVKAWEEMAQGYGVDPKTVLIRDFPSHGYNQIIACPWIEFYSTCEHHLLPFTGFAHVAYLPSKGDLKAGRVVGLSKLGRLVDVFARRLQIQEQMTEQIANALQENLSPQGVAVTVQARHMCMSCRGVMKQRSVMVTSSMRGVFLDDVSARQEFFKLIEIAKHSST